LLRRFGRPLHGWEVISYLPMAHIAERLATHYLHLAERLVVTTCPTPTLLPVHLAAVRPHLFVGVPRVWWTARKLIEAGFDRDPVLRHQFDEGLAAGVRIVRARAAGQPVGQGLLARWRDADVAVFAGARALMGLDRCRVAISASAPLGAELAEFFLALGVPLSEMYGLSETCGPVAWRADDVHPGTCGPPMPGCEVRLAADGEVLVRGGNVVGGYVAGDGTSVQAVDEGGFFHTGDLGSFDADGCLTVTGRSKDMIITPGGTNVSPDRIEALLRRSPLVDDVCVVGDGRRFLAALVTVDPGVARAMLGTEAANLDDETVATHPSVRRAIGDHVAAINATLAPEERVRRHAVLADRWVPGSTLVTPTDKLRRDSIIRRYADRIEQLYATGG
jgi:long-chain acyl-CoA synthetase